MRNVRKIVQYTYVQLQYAFQLQVALLYYGYLYWVTLSSVQLVWSQLHPALLGTFVLNTVSNISRYMYSTCQVLYLFEAV